MLHQQITISTATKIGLLCASAACTFIVLLLYSIDPFLPVVAWWRVILLTLIIFAGARYLFHLWHAGGELDEDGEPHPAKRSFASIRAARRSLRAERTQEGAPDVYYPDEQDWEYSHPIQTDKPDKGSSSLIL